MTLRSAAQPLALLAAAALAFGLSACSTDVPLIGGSTGDRDGQPGQSEQNGQAEGDGDRVFDSTDDAVIIAIETALSDKNAKAGWEGSTLRVSLDGSATDPTSWLWCTAVEALIADDESAVMVYSDGELPCDERPGY